MKKMPLIISMLFIGAAFAYADTETKMANPATDHHLYRTKPLQGQIVSLTKNGFVLKTERIVEETVTEITVPEGVSIKDPTTTSSQGTLKAGETVTVFGTKLASGEFVANNITLNQAQVTPTHSEGKNGGNL